MDGMVYDWTPKEPIKEPTGALGDVIRFMKSIFEILLATPVSIFCQMTCFTYAISKFKLACMWAIDKT